MNTQNRRWMRAGAAAIYALAAEVERWPEWLPHYRWVTVLERDGNRKLVEMAASRDGLPVKWQAVQELFPDEPRITFRHVRGITCGMDVVWSFAPQDGGTLVTISHALKLHWRGPTKWAAVGDWVADHMIGPHFVEPIAGKTLHHIRRMAEERP